MKLFVSRQGLLDPSPRGPVYFLYSAEYLPERVLFVTTAYVAAGVPQFSHVPPLLNWLKVPVSKSPFHATVLVEEDEVVMVVGSVIALSVLEVVEVSVVVEVELTVVELKLVVVGTEVVPVAVPARIEKSSM